MISLDGEALASAAGAEVLASGVEEGPRRAVIDSREVGLDKPDPRIFLAALSELGVAPAEAAHVGDSVPRDVKGALAAGLLLLASGCGRSDGKPGAFPPPEVAVLTIEPHSVEESFEFPGQVQPFRRVEVRARVDGIIEARFARSKRKSSR